MSLGDDSFTYLNLAVVGFFPPFAHLFEKLCHRQFEYINSNVCETEELHTENGNRFKEEFSIGVFIRKCFRHFGAT